MFTLYFPTDSRVTNTRLSHPDFKVKKRQRSVCISYTKQAGIFRLKNDFIPVKRKGLERVGASRRGVPSSQGDHYLRTRHRSCSARERDAAAAARSTAAAWRASTLPELPGPSRRSSRGRCSSGDGGRGSCGGCSVTPGQHRDRGGLQSCSRGSLEGFSKATREVLPTGRGSAQQTPAGWRTDREQP